MSGPKPSIFAVRNQTHAMIWHIIIVLTKMTEIRMALRLSLKNSCNLVTVDLLYAFRILRIREILSKRYNRGSRAKRNRPL